MLLLIKQATILCPSSKHHLKKRDILVKNGWIEKIAISIEDKKAKRIEYRLV
jgi:dihydroorotase